MSHPSVWYFAHPVGPPCACHIFARSIEGVIGTIHLKTHLAQVACNVARAKRWLRWCWEVAPRIAIVAPWIPHVELLDDAIPEHRERGLRDNCAAAALCSGIILAGGRVSPGMQRERMACMHADYPQREQHPSYRSSTVADLTSLGPEPPTDHDDPLVHAVILGLRALR